MNSVIAPQGSIIDISTINPVSSDTFHEILSINMSSLKSINIYENIISFTSEKGIQERKLNTNSPYVSKMNNDETHNNHINNLYKQTVELYLLQLKLMSSNYECYDINELERAFSSLKGSLVYFENYYQFLYSESIRKRKEKGIDEETIIKETSNNHNKVIYEFYHNYRVYIDNIRTAIISIIRKEEFNNSFKNQENQSTLEYSDFKVNYFHLRNKLLALLKIDKCESDFFKILLNNRYKHVQTKILINSLKNLKKQYLFNIEKEFFNEVIEYLNQVALETSDTHLELNALEYITNKDKDNFKKSLLNSFKYYIPQYKDENIKDWFKRCVDGEIRTICDNPKEQLERSLLLPQILDLLIKEEFSYDSDYDKQILSYILNKLIKNISLTAKSYDKYNYVFSFISLYKLFSLNEENNFKVVDIIIDFLSTFTQKQLMLTGKVCNMISCFTPHDTIEQQKKFIEYVRILSSGLISLTHSIQDHKRDEIIKMMDSSTDLYSFQVKIISAVRLLEIFNSLSDSENGNLDFIYSIKRIYDSLKEYPLNAYTISLMSLLGSLIKQIWYDILKKSVKNDFIDNNDNLTHDEIETLKLIEILCRYTEKNLSDITKLEKDNPEQNLDVLNASIELTKNVGIISDIKINNERIFKPKDNGQFMNIQGSLIFIITLSEYIENLSDISNKKHKALKRIFESLESTIYKTEKKYHRIIEMLDEKYSFESIQSDAKNHIIYTSTGKVVKNNKTDNDKINDRIQSMII